LREFLKEVGIIVLSICIALTAEQAVEWAHWHREVAIARQALRAEIAANNTNFLAFRVAIAPCVAREIARADQAISTLEAGGKLEPIAPLRATASSLIRSSEWEADRASQVLTHFPRDELALISRHYDQAADLRNWGEADFWTDLMVLQKPLDGITRSDILHLRVSLEKLRNMERLTVTNSRRQLRNSERLGIPVTTDAERVKIFCTQSREEYFRYRSAQDLR